MKLKSDEPKRRLHARLITRRRGGGHEFLLSHRDFRFAAECERMRVDRNGSTLALLLIRLPRGKSRVEDVEFLSRVLEGRLRVTDTPGFLDDGRVGVLLPDTSAEGAWKVAADVSEVFPPGPDRPQCDVLSYPQARRGRVGAGEGPLAEDPVGAPAETPESESSEFFFARKLPLWKRSIDVVGATIGLVTTLPVVLAAAAAVKLTSPGPAFFVQEREGRGGERFRIWKLRTMCLDAEQQKEALRAHSQQDGPAFKMRRDPRTTALGRLLRSTSIDELPQFWNVLKGEMSLVGPRPLPTEESLACEGWQRRRLDVTPGMTCTWQVVGRGRVRFDDWVRMDLQYAARHSVWHDLKLVCVTLPSLIFQKGMR
ncbi:MAG TPA: sugar transferase [Lacipirellulaceae bacterium]|nr:sugar transferase [Lacipirellulaceae bacterium]